MRKIIAMTLGAGMAFFTMACEQDTQQSTNENLEQVAEESREAAQAAGEAIEEGANDFSNWVSDRMVEVDQGYDELKPKVEKSSSEMKAEWNQKLDEIQVKRMEWERDWEEFKKNAADHTEDERETIRVSLRNGLDALGDQIEELERSLSN